MNSSMTCLTAAALAAALAGTGTQGQERPAAQGRPRAAAATTTGPSDEDAIRAQAGEFVKAFADGDAKALAAAWTEQAEYYEDSGATLQGRAAIEQAYADFFEAHPGARIDVQIDSIRFPARDLAVEEGVLVLTHAGPELPTSSNYFAVHVREDGEWKTAIVREWAGAEDSLQDLGWLIGDWSATTPKGEVRLSFSWNSAKSGIEARFNVTENGQTVSSGHQQIMRDPQTGQLHSWMFDDEGGHGESFWYRDGNRWVLDAAGISADGSETAAANILTRLNDDEFMWRSVNRIQGSDALPDTDPIKVTRDKSGN
jgi:uncharacterized protein (TIGR02246 family)